MRIVEKGQGPPLVLVPSLQGRWEYLQRTVDALAASHRVITFSLCDEGSWGSPYDASRGLDAFVHQVRAVLDEIRVERAAICGFSFGGRVALRFAARHPERTGALILVSTPGPGWHMKASHRGYAQRPWLGAPVFFAGAPGRIRAELMAALPRPKDRWRFIGEFARTLITAPLSPTRMGARALLLEQSDGAADCPAVVAPTLIVTGRQGLDHVVDADGTAAYMKLIADARTATLANAGHFGCITQAHAFATAIETFVRESVASSGNATVRGGVAPREVKNDAA